MSMAWTRGASEERHCEVWYSAATSSAVMPVMAVNDVPSDVCQALTPRT